MAILASRTYILDGRHTYDRRKRTRRSTVPNIRYALLLVCVGLTTARPIPGQVRGTDRVEVRGSTDTVRIMPGSGIVDGSRAPGRRLFFDVYILPCDYSKSDSIESIGTYAQETRVTVVRGQRSLVLVTRYSGRGEVIVDSSGYDASTLTPLWRRARKGSTVLAVAIRGNVVTSHLWIGANESAKTDTLRYAPAFLGGSEELLLEAISQLDVGSELSFPIITTGAESGQVEVRQAAASVLGIEPLRLKQGQLRDAIVIRVRGELTSTVWLDRKTHELLMIHREPFEGFCAERYMR